MNTHVMLDIETLGKGSFAAPWTLGAVKFNPMHLPESVDELMATTERFHIRFDLASVLRAGMQVDASTIDWWMEPKRDEARKSITDMPVIDLFEGLQGFSDWYGSDPFVPVWGNGATFDNVIVSNAYGRVGLSRPWSYKSDRCYRTLKSLDLTVLPGQVGTSHSSLDDALAQAWHLQHLVRHLDRGDGLSL